MESFSHVLDEKCGHFQNFIVVLFFFFFDKKEILLEIKKSTDYWNMSFFSCFVSQPICTTFTIIKLNNPKIYS